MLASFALVIIARALGETPEQGKPTPAIEIAKNERLDCTIQRFEALWKGWVESSRLQFSNRQHPQLGKLFSRTARVMADSATIICDIKMKISRGEKLEFPTSRLIKILRNTRKAIISGQRITHLKEVETWVLNKPLPGTLPTDASVKEYERKKRHNDKANTLIDRRKKPIQCCMFVALFIYQFLHRGGLHEFVAEYEDEVVRETFNRALSVDDAKTYERLQLKYHSRARLTPPQDRIPRHGLPFGEKTCIPRTVRNPMACGMPVVTNQLRLERNESDYINLNRNNRPQHLALAVPREELDTDSDSGSDYLSRRPQDRVN
ncbi:Fc.00g041060.m01.CDS01 [Cosmosporella sp. VM-42]